MYRTEYIDIRKTLTFDNWDDVQELATTLVRAKYDVKISAVDALNQRTREWGKEYSLDFVNPIYDFLRLKVEDDYRSKEIDGVEYVYVRQRMSFEGSEPALSAAKNLVHNDYIVALWTDGETFGDKYPKHYVVEFVHKKEGVEVVEKEL